MIKFAKILPFFGLFLGEILSAAQIKIATFNVENLFDAKNEGSEYREFIIGKSDWDAAKCANKLHAVCDVIRVLDADIIGVQEIENDFVMRELALLCGYKNFDFTKPPGSPFGVGIMSKFPLENRQIFSVANVKTRDILRADFDIDGVKFSVFVAHFLSQKNAISKKKAEIELLQKISHKPKNAILLGDFNTDYGYNSLLNELISTNNFVDLWKFSNDFSHVSGRKLDHILSSERDLRYQNDSFGVYKNSKVSDHFPIFAIFNTQTSKENAPKGDNQQNQTQNNTQNLTKITDLNDIKNLIANNKPLKNRINLSDLIVSYTDQNGYLVTQILDKNGDINSTISAKKTTGIYVFDKKADVKIGDVVDLQIEEIGEFKENPQIIRPKITKFHDKKADLSKICVPQIQMFNADFGDVICEISGTIKHGYFYPNFNPQKAIKIYSKRAKISDGDYSFKNVLIQKCDGEKELIIQ